MTQETKPKKTPLAKVLIGLVIVLLLAGLAGLGWMYYQTRQELLFLSSPTGQEELARREVEQVVNQLQQLVILPEEDPVVATITDAQALASESAFYKNAQNGDKLVVYPEAQQAFVYSPARNRIVNVGPLLIENAPVGENANGSTEQIGAQDQGEAVQVEVRNGSPTAGQATQVSNDISESYNVEVVAVAQAARQDYEQSLVVSFEGETELASVLAGEYNAQIVTSLPEGEASTAADILLIVAQ